MKTTTPSIREVIKFILGSCSLKLKSPDVATVQQRPITTLLKAGLIRHLLATFGTLSFRRSGVAGESFPFNPAQSDSFFRFCDQNPKHIFARLLLPQINVEGSCFQVMFILFLSSNKQIESGHLPEHSGISVL